MNSRITQSDIARAAGVHNTTVSLALRNSPLIPAATRDRIRGIAKSMGYCPDPALQALVAYRRNRQPLRCGEALAYVTQGGGRLGSHHEAIHEAHHRAATAKATELGYHLEPFRLGESGLSVRRLNSVLLHRGIRGVIFAAASTAGTDLSGLDWPRLAAVHLGDSATNPAMNQVTLDPTTVVRLAMQQVLYAGYRRVGLALPHDWDKLTDQVWSATFHAEQYRCHLKDRLPVLHLQSPLHTTPAAGISPHHAANDASSLLRWSRQYRPDVVLGLSPAVLAHIRDCGFQVPHDFAYADLMLTGAGSAGAGVWVDTVRMGALAVEMLSAQLQQNAFGPPPVATVTAVGGVWRPGPTLPEKPTSALETIHVTTLAASRV